MKKIAAIILLITATACSNASSEIANGAYQRVGASEFEQQHQMLTGLVIIPESDNKRTITLENGWGKNQFDASATQENTLTINDSNGPLYLISPIEKGKIALKIIDSDVIYQFTIVDKE